MTTPDTQGPPPQAAPPVARGTLELTYHRLLGARLYVHTWIRLFVVFVIVIGAFVARDVVGIEALAVPSLLVLAAVIAGYNAVAWFISRSRRKPLHNVAGYQLLLRLTFATITMDYIALTVAVWLVGGARSPFLVFYLLHVILSCLLLSRRAAIFAMALAYGLLSSLVVAEWQQWIPINYPIGAIAGVTPIDARYVTTLLLVYGLLLGLVGFLLIGLSELLRRGERELQTANVQLDRLSNMRRDLMHIALHDLKSPVGAISGFLGNLRDGLLGELNQRQQEWIERSLGRLGGLSDFLADLQTLAELDGDDLLEQQMEPIETGELLRAIGLESQDLAQERRHTLRVEVPEGIQTIRGVPRLVRVAISNYVTNSIKYTPEGGEIVVRASNVGNRVRIEVEDNGIGIAPEDQARLFDEFVRIRRRAAVRGATGSGLGLSIVRRIVQRHGGTFGVRSAVDEGSTFHVELPAAA